MQCHAINYVEDIESLKTIKRNEATLRGTSFPARCQSCRAAQSLDSAATSALAFEVLLGLNKRHLYKRSKHD